MILAVRNGGGSLFWRVIEEYKDSGDAIGERCSSIGAESLFRPIHTWGERCADTYGAFIVSFEGALFLSLNDDLFLISRNCYLFTVDCLPSKSGFP